MKNWLRRKLRAWLGIEDHGIRIHQLDTLYCNLAHIGVDVHFTEPHMILIYSRLNGGQLRHVEARFETLKELNDLVQELKSRYRTERETWDYPAGMHRHW